MGFFDFFKNKGVESNLDSVESEDKVILDLLKSRDFDADSLGVNDMYSVAESLKSYIGFTISSFHKIDKTEVLKNTAAITKLKRIVMHSVKLKEMVDDLVKYYHDPVIEILDKVNAKKNNENVIKLLKALREHKSRLDNLCSKLSFFVDFEDMLNSMTLPEKLGAELQKKLDSGDFYNAMTFLRDAVDKSIVGEVNIKYLVDINVLDRAKGMIYG